MGAPLGFAGRLPMLILLGLVVPAAQACGACGCTLHSDWSTQGVATGEGFQLDLRYDFFKQDDLRLGRSRVERSQLPLPNEQEVQLQTLNRNLTLGLDYSPGGDWGLNLQVPVFDRTHETIAPGDTETSASRSAGWGDVRVLVRYQGLTESRSVGVQLGFKLPTGRTTDTFNGGPQGGEALDRGLQLGTGTTDLLFGVYAFGNLGADWGYFAQAMVQLPLAEKNGFRPGNGLNCNFGVHFAGFEAIAPQLQVNLRAEKPEQGVNSDALNSGATLAYLSPGLRARLSRRLQVSAFVQIPIYQRVTGYQIEPRFLASMGLHYAF